MVSRATTRPGRSPSDAGWLFEAYTVADASTVGAGWQRLVLDAPALATRAAPGQFMLVGSAAFSPRASGPDYLKHPFFFASISPEAGQVSIVFDRSAPFAWEMADWATGTEVECIGPLGKGFPVTAEPAAEPLLLIGSGYGLAALAAALAGLHRDRPVALFSVGAPPVSPDPGLLGVTSRITCHVAGTLEQAWQEAAEAMPGAEVWAAGPQDFTQDVAGRALGEGRRCLVTVEAPIACGVGACLGCTSAGDGTWRTCREGPVVPAEWLKGVKRP